MVKRRALREVDEEISRKEGAEERERDTQCEDGFMESLRVNLLEVRGLAKTGKEEVLKYPALSGEKNAARATND